ncbi:unnamed protein product [Urochloa decumbens]|uniref:F-box domain-containing protein n=1 Tax=Urochloa decumbens TaxID=240449 RepID=A0ABC9GC14_9POAL
MAPPPPPLMDELIEEFLLRLPPEDPASLVRAALVCKPWSRLISCRRFRRRYREHHRTPPLLGSVQDLGRSNYRSLARFVSTSSFRPPRVELRGWSAIHSFHGRVLCCPPIFGDVLHKKRLVVWNLMTGEHRELPRLSWCPYPGPDWNAAVLCASSVGAGCSDPDCHRGPFLVVFLGTFDYNTVANVYSSETDAWGEATFTHNDYQQFCFLTGALVGNALYFSTSTRIELVKYDLTTRETSAINLPRQASGQYTVLMAMEDGRLGFATIQESKLNLWSKEDGQDGDARWEQSGIIELDALLPVEALSPEPHVVACADGGGVIFLWTCAGFFSIDVKSRRVKELLGLKGHGFGFSVVPVTSFCTPALGVANTGEGSGAGASSV